MVINDQYSNHRSPRICPRALGCNKCRADPGNVKWSSKDFVEADLRHDLRMRLAITQVGEPVLRQAGRFLDPAEIVTPEVQQLIDLMRETMRMAPGVGLAAPQIGLSLQLAVIEDTAESAATERSPVPFHVIANPRLELGPEFVEFYEGCLSVEGYQAVVPRARSVRVHALDHKGEPVVIDATGWYARILQHEIDHLNGTLYIDRMRSRTLSTARNFSRYWAGQPIEEVLATLEKGLAPKASQGEEKSGT